MVAGLFSLDRSRLRRNADADPLGLPADLSAAPAACRAVFLAAEAGAITWDRTRFPDVEFGVWSDAAGTGGNGRRRSRAESTFELTTWLQLDPAWPQLGGASITWPQPAADPFEALAQATVVALNSLYDSARTMSRALTGLTAAPAAPAPARTTAPSPQPHRRTFAASAVANSEHEVGAVLAGLTLRAERDGFEAGATLLNVDHAVTALADGPSRFLVTVTATAAAAPRIHLGANGISDRSVV